MTNEHPAGRPLEKAFPIINTALPEGPCFLFLREEPAASGDHKEQAKGISGSCVQSAAETILESPTFSLCCVRVKCPLSKPSVYLIIWRQEDDIDTK